METTVISNDISEKEGYIIETESSFNNQTNKGYFKLDGKLKVFNNFRLAKSISTRLQYETKIDYTIKEYSELLEKVII
jgi:hypothetical protein